MKENQPTLHAPLVNRFDELPTPHPLVRRGSTCPQCAQGRLDYNGVLDLECPACGYTASDGAGCT